LNKIKAWYNFAYRVWIPLSLGWGALVIVLTPYLRLDRAGALLVCGAIVAEVFHDKRYKLYVNNIQAGVNTTHIYLEVDVQGENRKEIEVTAHQTKTGRTVVTTETWPLYHLANQNEFYPYDGKRRWDIEGTMKRVDSRVDYAIVLSAIVGTVLWAFG